MADGYRVTCERVRGPRSMASFWFRILLSPWVELPHWPPQRVRIVRVADGAVVFESIEEPESGAALVQRIQADLGALDDDAFAAEWGLAP